MMQERFQFLPQPPAGRFTSLYQGETDKSQDSPLPGFASVNAGDPALYVGGGGINNGFKRQLDSSGQRSSEYASIHKSLLILANNKNAATTFRKSESVYILNPATFLDAMFCRNVTTDDPTGSVWISVFGQNHVPNKIPANRFMVYVVGPNASDAEYSGATAFLSSVRQTGENLMRTIVDYNKEAERRPELRLPKLETLRLCLISGAIFRHPDCSKADVAHALIGGMLTVTTGTESTPLKYLPDAIQFAYDENSFKMGYDLYRSEINPQKKQQQ